MAWPYSADLPNTTAQLATAPALPVAGPWQSSPRADLPLRVGTAWPYAAELPNTTAQLAAPMSRPVPLGGAGRSPLDTIGATLGLMGGGQGVPMAAVLNPRMNRAAQSQAAAAYMAELLALAGDPEAQTQAANTRMMSMANAARPRMQPRRPQPAQPAPAMASSWAQRGFVQQPDGTWMKVEQIPAPTEMPADMYMAGPGPVMYGDDQ